MPVQPVVVSKEDRLSPFFLPSSLFYLSYSRKVHELSLTLHVVTLRKLLAQDRSIPLPVSNFLLLFPPLPPSAFGQSQAPAFGQPQGQQPAIGGGLFGGAAQQPQSGGFTFGQSTNQPSQAPAFGQQAQQQAKPAGFGGFGATTGGATGGGFSFGELRTMRREKG